MDRSRFDVLTRAFARATDRRTAVRGFVAGVLGATAMSQVDAAPAPQACAKCNDECLNNYGCCDGLKCQRPGSGIGTCVAKSSTDDRCSVDEDCRSWEYCNNSGRCRNSYKCAEKGQRCKNNEDCKSGEKCKNGKCKDTNSCGRNGDRCKRNGDCCNALVCNRDTRKCEQ